MIDTRDDKLAIRVTATLDNQCTETYVNVHKSTIKFIA